MFRNQCRPRALWAGLVVALAGAPCLAAPAPVDFVRDVRPVLQASCYSCHGPDKQKGGFRLDARASALQAGGVSGKLILPGNSANSLLVRRLRGHEGQDRMPLKGEALPDAQIALIAAWIDQGAAWPDSAAGTDATIGKHWSFVKPARPQEPMVTDAAWVRNPIDRFVLARLEKEGLKPSPEATKETLIRRASLDLTGLPPTPKEVDDFLADAAPDAYEKLIDRLLASPHYGERWGRHWLDLARYADSHGYSRDSPRVIWKYRDWVIDALNRDLPFDQFVVEQIAGDMLPNAAVEQKVATGFHRNTQINMEGGIDVEQFRIESVFDRVATTGTVFLGLTVGCAQCHNHKFDPLPQKDYYRLFAFFNNADEPTLDLGGVSTMVMAERGGEPRKSHVFIKGDFTRPSDPVTPGTPGVLHPLTAASPDHPNRLDLARWLVDAENPLTARVTVNRIWQRYFGRGIVETENDFGTQGAPPTHPELLDWLAAEFSGTHKWSMKAFHRLVVTSATYRQSSKLTPELLSRDPYNKLLARQSRLRLDAEIVRDVSLRASGLLTDKVGGPGVYPPQPAGVSSLGQSDQNWATSTGPDRYRRAMYTFFFRATPHPALSAFDAPDATGTCTRRNRSNTPLQALTLLNDQGFVEFAQALARRVLREAPADDAARAEYAFRLCTGRKPDDDERQILLALLAKEVDAFGKTPDEAKALAGPDLPPGVDEVRTAAWTIVARAVLNLDETITRE